MTKEDLFESIGAIDQELLERSEKTTGVAKRIWKTALPVAACLCIIVAAVLLLPKRSAQDPTLASSPTDSTLPPPANGNWDAIFIQENPSNVGVSWLEKHPIHFWEDMNSEEIDAVIPERRPDWLQGTGSSGFDEDGVLRRIVLEMNTNVHNSKAVVYINGVDSQIPNCAIYPGKESVCNGVEFYIYEYADNRDRVRFQASTNILGHQMLFYLTVWKEDAEQAKVDFKQILESFTYYGEPEKPKWSAVTYERFPEIESRGITMQEAYDSETFGALLPKSVPEGMEWSYGHLHKVDNRGYLEAYWEQGDSSLRWKVSNYEPESDASRMTYGEDYVRYYRESNVVFDAAELSKELFSVLGTKLKVKFGVRYSDCVIFVELRELDVTYVWDQLVALGIINDDAETVYTDEKMDFQKEAAARADPIFGAYIPRLTETAAVVDMHRYESNLQNYLDVTILSSIDGIKLMNVRIRKAGESERIVAAKDLDAYDLSMHISPWDPDIPEAHRDTMVNPVFDGSEFSREIIEKRCFSMESDHYTPRVSFALKYDDVVIEVFSSGFTVDEIYEMLKR